MLQCKLTSKAQEVRHLFHWSVQYDAMKIAILQVYELVPEHYQQHFHSTKKICSMHQCTKLCFLRIQVILEVPYRKRKIMSLILKINGFLPVQNFVKNGVFATKRDILWLNVVVLKENKSDKCFHLVSLGFCVDENVFLATLSLFCNN